MCWMCAMGCAAAVCDTAMVCGVKRMVEGLDFPGFCPCLRRNGLYAGMTG